MTPWDAAGLPPRFRSWLDQQPLTTGSPRRRVLVPGCGSGYEVRAFADHGDDVLGIDFSDAAIERARGLGARVKKADFFFLGHAPFDLVYERTFLCALPRRMWPRWAACISALVRPGGTLAGFFFFDDNERGPPFGIAPDALHGLLDASFMLKEEQAIPAGESVPVLAGKERWQVWERRL